MGLIRFGGGVAEIRGSIGGTTFSRNTFGAYARNRISPTNPRSTRQILVRDRMQELVSQWTLVLSQSNRDSWDAFAAASPTVNKLGETIYLSGFQQFVRSNMARREAGATVITEAPTPGILPPGDLSFAISADESEQEISVAFSAADAWATEVGAHMLIYITQPFAAGRTYLNGPYQYLGKISGAAVPPTSPTVFAMPVPAGVGQKYMAYCRITRVNGALSAKYFDDCVVAA